MRILTTLAERDYFLGLAALLNSAVHHGTYVDKVVVGYREELPSWLPERKPSRNGETFKLPSGLPVELVKLDGSLHMVHEKPSWFKHLSEVLEPDAEEYFFFDSDIVINERMSFYGEWVAEGVGLCGDVLFVFDRRHPIRRKWSNLAQEQGAETVTALDHYYNSGFLAWKNEHRQFIADWNRAFAILAPHSGDMKKFRVKNRTATVLSTNQDSLNLAAMITEVPIAPIGPEAMGFNHGMRLMHHPIGPKPWRRKFLREFFSGKPPREADVQFWRYVNGSELQPLSAGKVRQKFILTRALRFLARWYRGS